MRNRNPLQGCSLQELLSTVGDAPASPRPNPSSEAGKEPAADTEAVPALSEKTGAEVAAAAGVAQASTTTGL